MPTLSGQRVLQERSRTGLGGREPSLRGGLDRAGLMLRVRSDQGLSNEEIDRRVCVGTDGGILDR